MKESSLTAPARLSAHDEALLKRRAALVARPQQALASLVDADELLVVAVGGARCALPLTALAGVVQLPRLTRLPGAPAFVEGVAHVHGRTVTVVSLAVVLGEQAPPARFGVLVDLGGEPFALGVTGLEGVHPPWAAAESPVPAGLSAAARQAIDSVGPGGVCRLALGRIIEHLTAGEVAGPEHEP